METGISLLKTLPLWAWAILGLAVVLRWAWIRRHTINGVARVKDGDSLVVAGRQIRIAGIDAPELTQVMLTAKERIEIGAMAKKHLEQLIGKRGMVSCRIVGKDKYGRTLAICHNTKGADLGRAMVRKGFAQAYGYRSRAQARKYYLDQWLAKLLRRGCWQYKGNWKPKAHRQAKPY